MKRNIFLVYLIAGACLLFFGLSRIIRAQEDTIALENTFGKVTFTHKAHTALASCKECHHMEETPPQKCTSCHTKDSKTNIQNAFHKNCIDCHKEKTKGPTACMDCHKK